MTLLSIGTISPNSFGAIRCEVVHVGSFDGRAFTEEEAALISRSGRRAHELYDHRQESQVIKVTAASSHAGQEFKAVTLVSGVPSETRLWTGGTVGVVRHYISPNDFEERPTDPDLIKKIVADRALIVGFRSYWDTRKEWERTEYPDASGVMFTRPDFDRRDLRMGLTETSDFVDFELPEGAGVLEVSPGNFVVPMAARWRVHETEWFRAAFQQYKIDGIIT